MGESETKLLLVSNPDERAEIESLLQEADAGEVHHGVGGDSTLSEFRELQPDVVILSAELDQGDARALASAIRDADRAVSIVLIGQRTGPIRNALDASDFQVDHFIGQPIAAKALLYAVRTGVNKTREARAVTAVQEVGLKSIDDDVVTKRAMTQSRIGEAMDEAIGAFVDEAIAAIPKSEDIVREKAAAGVVQALAPELDTAQASRAVPIAAPEDKTGKIPGAAAITGPASLAEPFEPSPATAAGANLFGGAAARAAGDDDTEPTGWREQTVVLGADQTPPPIATSDDALSDELPGGEFARELRRKMSKMAERLFPGESRDSVELGVSHGAHTEIDLGSLGGGHTAIQFPEELEPGTVAGAGDDTAPSTPLFSEGGTQPRVRADLGRESEARGVIGTAGNDVASLMSRLFDLGVTGRVTLRNAGAEKVVYLERGRPVFATSNLPHDRMGDLLFREGKLTRKQHIRSRELVAESGRRMGEVLVAEGFLKPKELLPAVHRHLEDLIYSLFAWRDGAFEVVEDVLPSSEQIRLSRHPAALAVEGIRRKYDLPYLLKLFGTSDPTLEVLAPARVRALVPQIELLPAEERVLGVIDGHRGLAELAKAAGTDLLTAAQVCFAMSALGAVELVSKTVPGTVAATAPASAIGEADTAIDRERILAKHELVVESDYFQFLGVRRDCSAFEIKRAYERALRDFEPGGFADELQNEMDRQLEEIRLVLFEAYAVLSDDQIRRSYLASLRD